MKRRSIKYFNRDKCRWCKNFLTKSEIAFWEDTCSKCQYGINVSAMKAVIEYNLKLEHGKVQA